MYHDTQSKCYAIRSTVYSINKCICASLSQLVVESKERGREVHTRKRKESHAFVDSAFTFGDESQSLKETCHEPRKETSAYFGLQLAMAMAMAVRHIIP